MIAFIFGWIVGVLSAFLVLGIFYLAHEDQPPEDLLHDNSVPLGNGPLPPHLQGQETAEKP